MEEGPIWIRELWHWVSPQFTIPTELLSSWLVMVILLVIGGLAGCRATLRPGKLQNVFEMALEYVRELSLKIAGPEGPRFLPLFATLFMFILIGNWSGLIPGFMSPTANLNINAGMALIVMVSTEFLNVKHKGPVGYFKHLCGPPYWLAPLFFLIRAMEIFTRPLSLTMRLFGNMVAKEIILAVLVYLITLFFFAHGVVYKLLLIVPLLLRPGIVILGALVGFVQAMVFTALAMFYIGTAFEQHHH